MFNYRELRDRITAMGYDGSHEDDAKIREVLLSIAIMFDDANLSESQQNVVLDLISQKGREALKKLPEKAIKSRWENFNYGNVKLGDYVRVKKNAYDSKWGEKHNGLVGILSEMGGGRCTVKYLGLSTGSVMIHPKENLESLKIV